MGNARRAENVNMFQCHLFGFVGCCCFFSSFIFVHSFCTRYALRFSLSLRFSLVDKLFYLVCKLVSASDRIGKLFRCVSECVLWMLFYFCQKASVLRAYMYVDMDACVCVSAEIFGILVRTERNWNERRNSIWKTCTQSNKLEKFIDLYGVVCDI